MKKPFAASREDQRLAMTAVKKTSEVVTTSAMEGTLTGAEEIIHKIETSPTINLVTDVPKEMAGQKSVFKMATEMTMRVANDQA